MNKKLRNIIKKTYYTFHFKPFVQSMTWNDTLFKFYISSLYVFNRSTGCIGAELTTIKWINQFVKKDDVFYDIGANIGLFGLYAAKKIGCKVFAFEPAFHNFNVLNRNIIVNKLNNMNAFCVAINNKIIVDNVFVQGLEAGEALTNFGKREHNVTDKDSFAQGCMGISIDELTKYLPFPNHIKIDVDGNEPLVVEGMNKTLKDSRLKSALIEFNEYINDTNKIKTIFFESGFRLFAVGESGNHIFIRTE